MSGPSPPMGPLQTGRFMHIVGLIILIAVGLSFGFMAIDGLGLENQQGPATVLGKQHRGPGRTYTRQVIGNRLQTIPQVTPEMYLLTLDIGGRPAEGAVAQGLYESVREGDRVRATYQRRRLTGALQVVAVAR